MRLRSTQGSVVRAATILLVASLVSIAAGLADSHADLLRAHQAFHNAFEYGLKNRLGASSFFSQNRSAYGAIEPSDHCRRARANAPEETFSRLARRWAWARRRQPPPFGAHSAYPQGAARDIVEG